MKPWFKNDFIIGFVSIILMVIGVTIHFSNQSKDVVALIFCVMGVTGYIYSKTLLYKKKIL